MARLEKKSVNRERKQNWGGGGKREKATIGLQSLAKSWDLGKDRLPTDFGQIEFLAQEEKSGRDPNKKNAEIEGMQRRNGGDGYQSAHFRSLKGWELKSPTFWNLLQFDKQIIGTGRGETHFSEVTKKKEGEGIGD